MIRAITVAILAVFPAWGQAPAFEVAAIKASSGDPKFRKGGVLPGGQVDMPNATIKDMIMGAYDVHADLITGGPKWLESDRFDILAKAPPGTPAPMIRAMLQTLLAERFKLAIHREEKVMPTYALVVGKNGPKMEASTDPEKRGCSWMPGTGGLRRRECHNLTMAQMASALPGWGGVGIDRTVLDMTELKGAYDFAFEIGSPNMGKGDGRREGEAPLVKDDGGPTIFDGLAQIGLKLEPRKRAMALIVIDHVERVPTEN